MKRSLFGMTAAISVVLGATLRAQQSSPQAQCENGPYYEFQVEKRVTPAPENPAPRYPLALRSANVEGQVLIQFVVDTEGLADTTSVKVFKSSHNLFTDAVRDVLPNMRFRAAELGGKKVCQLVQMPFVFSVTRPQDL